MLHGPQRSRVQLSFSLPSVCADQVERDLIDIGLVPVAEIARQGLEIASSVGITCRGAVRSILLIARVPWRNVRTLAADAGSRTSVQLARIILRERFGVEAQIKPHDPNLEAMLDANDAALVIGDPALHIDPETCPFSCLDLGAEWFALTSLPMVFAAWAGKPGIASREIEQITAESYTFGKAHLQEIIQSEHQKRGIDQHLAERYLHHHIRFEIGHQERQGLKTFLELADLKRSVVAST